MHGAKHPVTMKINRMKISLKKSHKQKRCSCPFCTQHYFNLSAPGMPGCLCRVWEFIKNSKLLHSIALFFFTSTHKCKEHEHACIYMCMRVWLSSRYCTVYACKCTVLAYGTVELVKSLQAISTVVYHCLVHAQLFNRCLSALSKPPWASC